MPQLSKITYWSICRVEVQQNRVVDSRDQLVREIELDFAGSTVPATGLDAGMKGCLFVQLSREIAKGTARQRAWGGCAG
jgi:hypothetical protein